LLSSRVPSFERPHSRFASLVLGLTNSSFLLLHLFDSRHPPPRSQLAPKSSVETPAWIVRNMLFLHPTPIPNSATSKFPPIDNSKTSIPYLLSHLAIRMSTAMEALSETRYAHPRNQQETELKIALVRTGETLMLLFLTLSGKFSEENYNQEGWEETITGVWGALPWLRCEATLLLGGSQMCEKPPGDEGMMACGRVSSIFIPSPRLETTLISIFLVFSQCKAVRYCSSGSFLSMRLVSLTPRPSLSLTSKSLSLAFSNSQNTKRSTGSPTRLCVTLRSGDRSLHERQCFFFFLSTVLLPPTRPSSIAFAD